MESKSWSSFYVQDSEFSYSKRIQKQQLGELNISSNQGDCCLKCPILFVVVIGNCLRKKGRDREGRNLCCLLKVFFLKEGIIRGFPSKSQWLGTDTDASQIFSLPLHLISLCIKRNIFKTLMEKFKLQKNWKVTRLFNHKCEFWEELIFTFYFNYYYSQSNFILQLKMTRNMWSQISSLFRVFFPHLF